METLRSNPNSTDWDLELRREVATEAATEGIVAGWSEDAAEQTRDGAGEGLISVSPARVRLQKYNIIY